MVGELIAGAIIGAAGSLAGALGAGYLDVQRTKLEQQREDDRIVAEHIVSEEAEAIQEVSFQLNRLNRDYRIAVKMAAKRYLTESEYDEKYNLEFRELQKAIDRATPFLSDYGQRMLDQYANHLVQADTYAKVHAGTEDELTPRGGDWYELVEIDDPALDVETWEQDYKIAKDALKESINSSLTLLSNRE